MFEMRAVLFYVNYPPHFQQLGPNYSQFIQRFKHNYVYNLNMGLTDDILLYLQILLNSPRYFGTFLNVALARLLNFS